MEARRHLGPIIAGRESELTPIIRSRFVDGDTYTLDEYLDANQQWEELRQAVKEYFNRYDLFLCPTVPMTAFPHGQDEFHIEGAALVGRHTLRRHSALGPDRLAGNLGALRLERRRPAHRRPARGPPLRRADAAAGRPRAGGRRAGGAAAGGGVRAVGAAASSLDLAQLHGIFST